jgi:hypothetical protein
LAANLRSVCDFTNVVATGLWPVNERRIIRSDWTPHRAVAKDFRMKRDFRREDAP